VETNNFKSYIQLNTGTLQNLHYHGTKNEVTSTWIWNLRSTQWWRFKSRSSGLWHCAVLW